MADRHFHVRCYNDFLIYIKSFTLQYVARQSYGTNIQLDPYLRRCLMAPEIGVIVFFHQLFRLVPLNKYACMVSNIIGTVMPALVKETALCKSSKLPIFSSQYVKAKCKTHIMMMYISCLGNVWELLSTREDIDGVRLSELLGDGFLWRNEYKMKSTYVKNVRTLHDTLFMGGVLRCMLHNEGYVTLLLFALTEHYQRRYRQNNQPFSIFEKNTSMSEEVFRRLQPLAAIANGAMTTLFGAWHMGTSIKLKSALGNNIVFNNQQCYAFALALYNMSCEIDGDERLIWDKTLFSLKYDCREPLSPKHDCREPYSETEHFLNKINMLRAKVVDVFVRLDKPLLHIVAGPISPKEVMLSIKQQGFGKSVSVKVPLQMNVDADVNAFTKNKVVTQYILCQGLSSISCFNEAYIRNTGTLEKGTKDAEETMHSNRQFVCHSNKICTGPGLCTFSLYRTQDNTGVASCMNTFNFHISGNFLEFCISRAAVELDMMKGNPQNMYPVAIPISAQHNTCTTVDLHGLLNPETALSRTKMVWDSASLPRAGPSKTTGFPAYNVYVKYPNDTQQFIQNRMPPAQPSSIARTKRPYPTNVNARGEKYDDCMPLSKRPRAYAVFDDRGIVCDQHRYTGSDMKRMMKRSVSWELHKNNINTSCFEGKTLEDRLREVLSWYLSEGGVEFDPRKQNYIASLEKETGALLPFSVLFLAEVEYTMRYTQIADQLKVHDLFLSRSMICTYGGFSRGNAYTPLTSKNMLSYISTQHKLQRLHDKYCMSEDVLCELMKRQDIDLGRVRTLVKQFIEKKRSLMPMCFARNRAEGLVSSLIYGSEHSVDRFLATTPLLKAVRLGLRQGSESMHVISVLENKYMKGQS